MRIPFIMEQKLYNLEGRRPGRLSRKKSKHLSHYMNLNLKLNNGNHQGAHADFAMYM